MVPQVQPALQFVGSPLPVVVNPNAAGPQVAGCLVAVLGHVLPWHAGLGSLDGEEVEAFSILAGLTLGPTPLREGFFDSIAGVAHSPTVPPG